MKLAEGPSPKEVSLCTMLLKDVLKVLDKKVYSFFSYGATMFPHPPSWQVDIDFHVILTEPLSRAEGDAISGAQRSLAERYSIKNGLDGYYLLRDEAERTGSPKDQVRSGVQDTVWALHRAHIHAGRFKLLFGEDPRAFVPEPAWGEYVPALKEELERIREPQYGVLNLARLMYSWTERDVVISKYESGQWALKNIDSKWHPVLRAALRGYEGKQHARDEEVLNEMFPTFLTFASGEIAKLACTSVYNQTETREGFSEPDPAITATGIEAA
jgi:hypothetical protein